nr:putative B3 domain-containing protein Os03g0621600 [Lolium perenne]
MEEERMGKIPTEPIWPEVAGAVAGESAAGEEAERACVSGRHCGLGKDWGGRACVGSTSPLVWSYRPGAGGSTGQAPATEKLKLGSPETPDEGPSMKRRVANVGHFQLDVGQDQFLRIVFKPTFDRLQIPHDFVRWFGEIPSNIIVTINTGCYWRMTTVMEGDDAYIDQGWAAFAVAHQLQIGQFLVFQKVSTFQYNVVIFDYTCTEVMTMCRYHGDATRCVIFQNHV